MTDEPPPPEVDWQCAECKAEGVTRFHANTPARNFFQWVIWEHERLSPECSGVNINLQVPYAVPSRKDLKRYDEEEEKKRERERAKRLQARRRALAARKGRKNAK